MNVHNQNDFDKIDRVAYLMMRASNLQEVIEILIPRDPPRTQNEYVRVKSSLIHNLLSCQPNMSNTTAPPEVAYRVLPCRFTPLDLLKTHLTVAVIFLTQGINGDAGRAIQAMQGTAGQFADDRILVSGGKLGFGLLTGLIRLRSRRRYEPMIETALWCQVEADKGASHNYHKVHSSEAISLCHDLYVFVQDCALVTGHDRNLGGEIGTIEMPPYEFFVENIRQDASGLDKKTQGKLDIKGWFGKL